MLHKSAGERRRRALGDTVHRRFANMGGATFGPRHLRLEPLEDRRMLAAVTVTTLADSVDLEDGVVSLREAILATNLVNGHDTIDFDPSLFAQERGVILLTKGELRITDALTIQGPGSDLLTIDASGADPTPTEGDGDGIRIFLVNDSDEAVQSRFRLIGVTLTGGDAKEQGGAVSTFEPIELIESTISGNSVSSSGVRAGGIWAAGKASVFLEGSTISANRGDGIFTESGLLTMRHSWVTANEGIGINAYEIEISRSVIADNFSSGVLLYGGSGRISQSEVSNNHGRGIHSDSNGELLVVESLVSGNRGGGIVSQPFENEGNGGKLSLLSSTISGNGRYHEGVPGGVLAAVPVTITSSTITANVAGSFVGSVGLFLAAKPDATSIQSSVITNSILAGNFIWIGGPVPEPNDYSSRGVTGPLLASFSILGTTNSPIDTFPDSFNYFGVDPLLGPLVENGGPTKTHALLPGSPAIDRGDPSIQQHLEEYDQRGVPFLRVKDGDLLTDIAIDIGAYEVQSPPIADFDVSGDVTGRDFLIWQRGFGSESASQLEGNSDDDNDVDASDLRVWEVLFGTEPVPLAAFATEISEPSLTMTPLWGPPPAGIDAGGRPFMPDDAQDAVFDEMHAANSAVSGFTMHSASRQSPESSNLPVDDDGTQGRPHETLSRDEFEALLDELCHWRAWSARAFPTRPR